MTYRATKLFKATNGDLLVQPAPLYVEHVRTAGTVTVNSANVWTNFETATDLTLAAKAGDLVAVGLNCLYEAEAVALQMNAVSVVSGAPVNGWGTADDNSLNGVLGWWGPSSRQAPIGATVYRTLVAADISGGNVVIRLRAKTAAAVAKQVYGTAANPLRFWAHNYR